MLGRQQARKAVGCRLGQGTGRQCQEREGQERNRGAAKPRCVMGHALVLAVPPAGAKHLATGEVAQATSLETQALDHPVLIIGPDL